LLQRQQLSLCRLLLQLLSPVRLPQLLLYQSSLQLLWYRSLLCSQQRLQPPVQQWPRKVQLRRGPWGPSRHNQHKQRRQRRQQ
jgi:hypothetical protein